MRGSSGWMVAGAVVLTVGVWLLARGEQSAAVASSPVQRSESGAPAGAVQLADSALAASQPPASEPPAQAKLGAAQAPAPSAAGSSAPSAHSAAPAQADLPLEQKWERRYAGLDSGEIHSRVSYLHEQIEAEAAQHFERLHDEGRYRALPIARDAQGRVQNPLLALGASDSIRHVFELPSRDEWQVVELPRADYPELYELWDEKQWLVRRFEALEHVDED